MKQYVPSVFMIAMLTACAVDTSEGDPGNAAEEALTAKPAKRATNGVLSIGTEARFASAVSSPGVERQGISEYDRSRSGDAVFVSAQ